MSVSRRTFIGLSLGFSVAGLGCYSSESKNLVTGNEKFTKPLKLPPILEGSTKDGRTIYELTVQKGTTEFLEGVKTATFGYDGSYLGPIIRVKRGEDLSFKIHNKLGEETALHWHGLHIPPSMDGGPHQAIPVGETWKPEFTINQPASTCWYHSHQLHKTGEQVYRGLAGLFYIDDDISEKLLIPSEYGVDDFPVVIQDRSFNRDGSLRYITSMPDRMMGMVGDFILVNGTMKPQLKVKKRRIRLRILNGANAKIYNLRFSDGRKFLQIATDGGFLAKPVTLTELQLSPAERAEIVVELDAKGDIFLEDIPSKNGTGMGGMMGNRRRQSGPMNVLRITSKAAEASANSLPNQLITVRSWAEKDSVKTRKFVLQMRMGMMTGDGERFSINGRAMDMKRIDETIKLDNIEIWEIENRSMMAHPFHIHDIQFRILDRNGNPPPDNEQGLKDTVLVQPRETVRVITQFENFADDTNPYMYHCHTLEHEDGGMMGQFLVKK